jgi:hypothetical protein
VEAEEVKAKVQNWLLGEGWQLAEKLHDDAVWLLDAQDGGGRHIVIGQKKGKLDQVLLEAAVALSENHRERFEALGFEDRQALLWDLRFRLLHLGLEFHGAQEPFVRVVLGQRIYLDGLSQDAFLQRVSQVRNGIIAVIWTVARHLNLAPGDTEASGGGVN